MTGKEAGASVLAALAAMLERKLGPVLQRLGALEERQTPAPAPAATFGENEAKALIEAALKQLPAPVSAEEITSMIATAVKGYADAQVAGFERITQSNKQVTDALEQAMKASVGEGQLKTMLQEAVEAIPRLTVEQAKEMIAKTVAEAAAAIPVPKDGEPGRDALHIEMLPYIEPDRSYARGTYASHRGGIVRSMRTTDYLDTLKPGETVETKGWQVIWSGTAERAVEQVDERTFIFRDTDTAGRVTETKFSLPVMIYRGVWREGDYQRGDTATWGGSLWHCEEPTKEKPGTGKGWKLAVKRGADGKDAKQVAHVDR